jgi:hypothetical protein
VNFIEKKKEKRKVDAPVITFVGVGDSVMWRVSMENFIVSFILE